MLSTNVKDSEGRIPVKFQKLPVSLMTPTMMAGTYGLEVTPMSLNMLTA